MIRIDKTLLVVALAGLNCSVQAVTADNRYDTINERNIFHLNSPPPAAETKKEPDVLDRKIDLSGISNVGGHKKAWFVVAAKAGSKDLPLYLNLSEGERQDFLEVVSISEDEGEVKVLNSGNSMVLSLKNNSLKPQAVAPSAPNPSAPPIVHSTPQTPPSPTATYGNNATPSYGAATPAYNYNNNNGGYSGGGVTVSGGNPITASSSGQTTENGGGLRTIPTRTLRLAPVPAQQQNVDPLTQRVMMEVQQQQAIQNGQQLPPLPPLP